MSSSVVYSCVAEPLPKYLRQLGIWATTLLALGGAQPGDLFVHVLDGERAADVTTFLGERGIPFAHMARFGDGRYCNKVAQLRSPQLRRREYVALCDTGLAFAAPIDRWIGLGRAAAKLVDGPNPPVEILEQLYRRAGFTRFPERAPCSRSPRLTYANNCNGGLYLLRTDQLGFGLAMWELGEPVTLLPPAANFPLHFGPQRYDGSVVTPVVLHYHNRVDANGALEPIGIPQVDERVRAVNAVLTP